VRVLVVYGSSRGGTAGLARMVAEAFVGLGLPADLGDAAEVDDVEAYDVVVVGGALYNDRWHEEAVWFVERTAPALQERLVWFFSSGPLDDSARSGALAPVPQVGKLARLIDIRGHQTFGGRRERRPGGVLRSLLAWGPPGDYRDEAHVREWVARIVAQGHLSEG
jgi:menaquinone-dependent protoporphyrinogen oxidase